MDNLYNLNSEQKIAMEEMGKPLLILAGAGSGKTRVITHKFAYIVKEHNINPYKILSVTFTNKAAKEMKERAITLLETHYNNYINPNYLWINTFHSICGKILRREIDNLGYTTNFSIYDTNDSKKLIQEIYKSYSIDKNQFGSALSYTSNWKNQLISPVEALQEANDENSKIKETYAKIYEMYEKKLKENNALDFDDLIKKTIELFQKYDEIRKKYSDLFEYIMVDEFQDTNHSQYLLIKLLAKKDNLCVVGDDDQSIYSWRGADITNILENFQKDFPNSKLIKLEQNYRSTNTILSAANSLIAKNTNRIPKNLWSSLGDGDKINIALSKKDREEAEFVGTKIKEMYNKKGNIAIFYRMNFQSRLFEEILNKLRIKYKIFGGVAFYDRKEIKDLLSYLTVIYNPNDSIALKRIINIPGRGIGKTSLPKIDEIAEKYNISCYQAIEYACEKNLINKGTKSLKNFMNLIKSLKQKKIELFKHLIDYDEAILQNETIQNNPNKEGTVDLFGDNLLTNYNENEKKNYNEEEIAINNKDNPEFKPEEHPLSELVSYLINTIEYRSYLKKECKDNEQEFEDRKANIEELQRSIYIFEEDKMDDIDNGDNTELPTLGNFLMEVNLQTDIDELDEKSDFVSLMTIHKSKGLEFDTVFITGCDEGILPHYRFDEMGDTSILEEERRLFYVAITRAKKTLYITTAGERYTYGRPNFYQESSFLREIDNQFIIEEEIDLNKKLYKRGQWEENFQQKKEKVKQIMKKNTELTSNHSLITTANGIKINDILYHPSFGKVKIKKINLNGDLTSILIIDENGTNRNLIIKYAKLSKVPYNEN